MTSREDSGDNERERGMDGGDEAVEGKERLVGDGCDSNISTSPSLSTSMGMLASSSSPSCDSEDSTTTVPNPVQHAVSEDHAIGTGSLDEGGASDS
jgi:hypothetical protein